MVSIHGVFWQESRESLTIKFSQCECMNIEVDLFEQDWRGYEPMLSGFKANTSTIEPSHLVNVNFPNNEWQDPEKAEAASLAIIFVAYFDHQTPAFAWWKYHENTSFGQSSLFLRDALAEKHAVLVIIHHLLGESLPIPKNSLFLSVLLQEHPLKT